MQAAEENASGCMGFLMQMSRKWSRIKTAANKVLRQCKQLRRFQPKCKRLLGFSDGKSSPLVQSPLSDGDDDID
ncbi:hypothetical protein Q3G72_030831 [Acer saccharum]|nr:hypothetical protein Q3G72_030831 [Acer saccharum]